jgi:hypothetical protein
MNEICFILGAGLIVVSVLLIRKTSPYSSCGGTKYERRRQRRLIGMMLFIVAVLFIAFGILTQFALSPP